MIPEFVIMALIMIGGLAYALRVKIRSRSRLDEILQELEREGR